MSVIYDAFLSTYYVINFNLYSLHQNCASALFRNQFFNFVEDLKC
jgi:hypothetical protein